MRHDIVLPNLGVTSDEVVIAAWLVAPGTTVTVGTGLVDVETEKSLVTVEATVAGTLVETRAETGATVRAGDVIGVIEG